MDELSYWGAHARRDVARIDRVRTIIPGDLRRGGAGDAIARATRIDSDRKRSRSGWNGSVLRIPNLGTDSDLCGCRAKVARVPAGISVRRPILLPCIALVIRDA